MFVPDPNLYDLTAPASAFASERDDAWFTANPARNWRVRAMLEGESPLSDQMAARDPRSRIYALVLDHAKAGDKRRMAGRTVYPLVVLKPDSLTPVELKRLLYGQAEFMVRWFRRTSRSPATAGSAQ